MCERAETTRQPSELLTGGSLQGDPGADPGQMLSSLFGLKQTRVEQFQG